MTLTYDMTFLVILLSSVYDSVIHEEKKHCIVHPSIQDDPNEMSEYAAGLNMILTYYHFQDDSADEGSQKAWAGYAML